MVFQKVHVHVGKVPGDFVRKIHGWTKSMLQQLVGDRHYRPGFHPAQVAAQPSDPMILPIVALLFLVGEFG